MSSLVTSEISKVVSFKPQPEFDLESLRDTLGIDAIGTKELESQLREEISVYLTGTFFNSETNRSNKKSYKTLSEECNVSHTYIWKFHMKEQAICITNMNKIANFFKVRYLVSNFEDHSAS